MTQTLVDELPRQQERCREILEAAISIGSAGVFLATSLRETLKRAEIASASGDVVAMIRACEDLRGYKE